MRLPGGLFVGSFESLEDVIAKGANVTSADEQRGATLERKSKRERERESERESESADEQRGTTRSLSLFLFLSFSLSPSLPLCAADEQRDKPSYSLNTALIQSYYSLHTALIHS